MAEHRGRVAAVMCGVGAAFDFISGHKPQAPRWLRERGGEWLDGGTSRPRCRGDVRRGRGLRFYFGTQTAGAALAAGTRRRMAVSPAHRTAPPVAPLFFPEPA